MRGRFFTPRPTKRTRRREGNKKDGRTQLPELDHSLSEDRRAQRLERVLKRGAIIVPESIAAAEEKHQGHAEAPVWIWSRALRWLASHAGLPPFAQSRPTVRCMCCSQQAPSAPTVGPAPLGCLLQVGAPLRVLRPASPPGADCWPNEAHGLGASERPPACVAGSPCMRCRLRRLQTRAHSRRGTTIKLTVADC